MRKRKNGKVKYQIWKTLIDPLKEKQNEKQVMKKRDREKRTGGDEKEMIDSDDW